MFKVHELLVDENDVHLLPINNIPPATEMEWEPEADANEREPKYESSEKD